MNTCDTCKHWKPPESYRVMVGKDVETRTPLHGRCSCPALNLYHNNDHAGHEFTRLDGMFCIDGTHFHGTGPKFGCLHHELKKFPTVAEGSKILGEAFTDHWVKSWGETP